jgi:hypothetical protein
MAYLPTLMLATKNFLEDGLLSRSSLAQKTTSGAARNDTSRKTSSLVSAVCPRDHQYRLCLRLMPLHYCAIIALRSTRLGREAEECPGGKNPYSLWLLRHRPFRLIPPCFEKLCLTKELHRAGTDCLYMAGVTPWRRQVIHLPINYSLFLKK